MPSDKLMAGVVVAVATVPETPLAVVTDTLVTVPPPLAAIEIDPAPLVIVMPLPAVSVVRVNPVPLPMSNAPFAGVEERPVPPPAMGTRPQEGAALVVAMRT